MSVNTVGIQCIDWWVVMGYSIAHSSTTCFWHVVVQTNQEIEMLAKGVKYTFDNEEDERRISFNEGQNSTPLIK